MYVKHNPEKTIIKISLLLSGKCLKWRREGREDMKGGGAQEQKYMGEEARQVISSSQSSFLSPKESVCHFPYSCDLYLISHPLYFDKR